MMNISQRTCDDLQYDDVLQMVCSYALSKGAVDVLQQKEFSSHKETITQRQQIVEDFLFLDSQLTTRPDNFVDISEAIKQLDSYHSRIDSEHIWAIASYVQSASTFITYCQQGSQPGTASLFQPIDEKLSYLLNEVQGALEEPGVVKKSHPRIARLVKEVERKREERSRYTRSFLQQYGDESTLNQPAFKDGRVVLPIRSDLKSQHEAIVHSTSGSGATLFVEPFPLVDLNNHVVMAQHNIDIEIAKILTELTTLLRSAKKELYLLIEQVSYGGSLYAISRWVKEYHCHAPTISTERRLLLVDFLHPLLKEKGVAITVDIASHIDSVLISGPNAGGKTVTMKSIGLAVLLHQHLGFVPLQEGSILPLFDSVFIDVGDDQSIEKSLSTFSAHLSHIADICHVVDDSSLVLLDELGTGTDPVQGGALARSIIEYMMEKGSLSIITSHHTVLKQFAYTHQRMLNASMEFDSTTHTPTFSILTGLPGESRAIETAQRMNLPSSIIDRAFQYLGKEALEISTIISSLEEKKREVDQLKSLMEKREKESVELHRSLELEKLRLAQTEYHLREGRIAELSHFITEKRKELENLVAELREGEITKKKTQKVKAFISSLEQKKREDQQKIASLDTKLSHQKQSSVSADTLQEGMSVYVGEKKHEGVIVRFEKKDSVVVAVGTMRITVKISDISPKATKKTKTLVQYVPTSVKAKSVIDVRGLFLDDALEEVKKQIEAALVHSLSSFSIIHGYGDGVLSEGIHRYLHTLTYIKTYYFATQEDGGHGKTYVEL